MNDDPLPMPAIKETGYHAPGGNLPLAKNYRNGYWWIDFEESIDSDHYRVIAQWMRGNGCGKFMQHYPNSIRFTEESDWVLFKIAFAGER